MVPPLDRARRRPRLRGPAPGRVLVPRGGTYGGAPGRGTRGTGSNNRAGLASSGAYGDTSSGRGAGADGNAGSDACRADLYDSRVRRQ